MGMHHYPGIRCSWPEPGCVLHLYLLVCQGKQNHTLGGQECQRNAKCPWGCLCTRLCLWTSIQILADLAGVHILPFSFLNCSLSKSVGRQQRGYNWSRFFSLVLEVTYPSFKHWHSLCDVFILMYVCGSLCWAACVSSALSPCVQCRGQARVSSNIAGPHGRKLNRQSVRRSPCD